MTPKQAGLPGPSTRVSVIVLVAGFVIGLIGVVLVVLPFVRAFSAPAFATPGEGRLHLGSGRYLVYEKTADSGFDFSGNRSTTITADEVTVTADDGGRFGAEQYYGSLEEITHNGSVYVGAVEFDVPAGGEYTVNVASPSPGSVLVARPFTETVRGSLKWILLIILGSVMVITGAVMWIVGASRRRRLRTAYAYGPNAYYGGVAAGWYPDPQQPGRHRYWDGTTWTEHIQ